MSIENASGESPSTPLTSGRLPALDGLRGLAIAMVMFCHFLPYSDRPGSLLGKLVFHVGRVGAVGVDLFFVLSGFLITGILLEARGKPHYFRNFYARRTLRIFPLYYFVLLVAFVVLPALWHGAFASEAMQELRHRQGWLWFYGTNVFLTLHPAADLCVPGEWANFNPFWSLAVEEHFYLVWPAIVLICGRRALGWVCAGACALAIISRAIFWRDGNIPGVYVFTLSRLDALALGGLLAIAVRGAPERLALLLRAAPWIGAGAFGLALGAILRNARQHGLDGDETLTIATVGNASVAVFFGMLIIQSITSRPGSAIYRLTHARGLRFLGKYSYGLYVYHVVLGGTLQRVFDQKQLQSWLVEHAHLGHAAYGLSILLYMLIAGGVSLGVALLSWHLLEKQFLKLKRYFEYGRTERAPVLEPVTV